MKPTKFIPAIIAFTFFFLLVGKSFFDNFEPAYTFPHWEHGASGYQLALKEAKASNKPLIVYFHTSWCGWCKKLDRNYLATFKAEEFLRTIPKVEINPDKGEAEKVLFKEFGLTGYPAFLLLNPKDLQSPIHLSPFVNGRDLSVDEFLDEIRRGMV